jgi:dCMP deaminase
MENNTTNFSFPLIIGIVGDLSSGKETIANYLKEVYQFEILLNYNPSFESCESGNKEADSNRDSEKIKESLDNIINEMNTKQTFKTKNIKQRIRELKSPFTLIYPYLSYDDYTLLSNKSCFRLLNIACPTKIRYNNFIIKHHKNSNFERFLELDSNISTDKNLNNIRNLAHFTINNDSSLENLKEKINKLITEIKNNFRPSWQDYFMSVAHIVAQRSNCVKQKVGTVIVKDGRIMATGYNGTPSGMLNCYEGGCERCNQNVEQGLDLDKCFCLHAEENAV